MHRLGVRHGLSARGKPSMTVFSNPVFTPPLRWLSATLLRATGWRCENEKPAVPKYVAVMAPHTSNWDFLYFIAAALIFRFELRWMGKHGLFKGPLGPIMKWFGGIPVNRNKAEGIVTDAISYLKDNPEAVLAIAPEGTRSKVTKWKSGFYRIAVGAEVPIVLSYLDYRTKTAGIGPIIQPSGDQDKDIGAMQEFYKAWHGKNASDQFKPDDEG